MILVSGFDTVVTVTEALPVALIPEQYAVTSVRLDVIYIGRLDIAPLFHTQRMRLKVTLAGSVPCRAIASAACGACVLRMEGTVLVTVFGAVRYERSTAGVTAWGIRSLGHWLHLRFRGFYKSLYYIVWERSNYNYTRKTFLIFLENDYDSHGSHDFPKCPYAETVL